MFIISIAITIIPAFFDKRIYPIATSCGFLIGFLAGVIFGPNPGDKYGHTHYGWAIWGVLFFISVAIGIIIEIIKKLKQNSEQ